MTNKDKHQKDRHIKVNFSYWERSTWFTNVDFTIIGAGIVGLTTALFIKQQNPKAKVIVLEKGNLPSGASTKNAGFACFGSATEIIADLQSHTPQEVQELVAARWYGIKALREMVGDANLDFQQLGGHEIFLQKDKHLFEKTEEQLPFLNQLLEETFQQAPFRISTNHFGFEGIVRQVITHQFEGQIDTGSMMLTLIQKAHQIGVLLLLGIEARTINSKVGSVEVGIQDFEFTTTKLIVTTNGYAAQFLPLDCQPCRAQVVVTKPLECLPFQGTFHFDEGYYYFRNINNRVLFGGGRNLDFKTENTTEFGLTPIVQHHLEELLKTVILPKTSFEVDYAWSGIMGMGAQKKPIIREVMPNIFCGVRLGGMGVALGANVGNQLATLTTNG